MTKQEAEVLVGVITQAAIHLSRTWVARMMFAAALETEELDHACKIVTALVFGLNARVADVLSYGSILERFDNTRKNKDLPYETGDSFCAAYEALKQYVLSECFNWAAA